MTEPRKIKTTCKTWLWQLIFPSAVPAPFHSFHAPSTALTYFLSPMGSLLWSPSHILVNARADHGQQCLRAAGQLRAIIPSWPSDILLPRALGKGFFMWISCMEVVPSVYCLHRAQVTFPNLSKPYLVTKTGSGQSWGVRDMLHKCGLGLGRGCNSNGKD